MDDLVNLIKRHKSTIQGGSATVASIGLDKAGAKALGPFVTPAVWTLNYATDGAKPDELDVGLFLIGLSTVTALPATVMSLLKAVIDDKTAEELAVARLSEDAKYRQYIFPCADYQHGLAAPEIMAYTVASNGGSAWLHPNGIWVFIVDARGQLVCDFRPRSFVKMCQPISPLEKGITGRYKYRIVHGRDK